MAAHLHGGIPDRDIDALGAYWEVFPGLRALLFSPNGREGYGDARVGADEVRGVVLEHGEFKAYRDRVRRVFDGWRREHAPRLRELAVGDSPKALIRDMSEDLLHRFAGLPLLDGYGVYQCLTDYWDEVMQDDVYLVVTEGWTDAARPRVLVPVRGKGTAETPDLTVKRKKYRMDLVPPGLVVARYFAVEHAEVDRLRTEQENITRELDEFIEEYSGEDGLLEGATSDAGKVTQAGVRTRLKAVAGDLPTGTLLLCSRATIGELKIASAPVATNQGFKSLIPNESVDSEYLYYHLLTLKRAMMDLATGSTFLEISKRDVAGIGLDVPPLPEQHAIAAVLSDIDGLIGSLEALIAKNLAIKQAAMQELLTGRTRLPGFGGKWEIVTLGEIGDTYGGLAGKTIVDFGDGEARYVAFLDVLEKVVLDDVAKERVGVARTESQNRVMVGDVLFNATSETPEDLAMGSMVVVDADELYLNSFCFGYRMTRRDRCDPLFLAYFSRGIPGRQAMYALAQGATRYNLSKKRFLMLQLPLPPLPEQRAIATVLSDMDAEITALEHRLHKTRAIKQGMMQQLLTGSIRLPIPDTAPQQNAEP